MTSYSFVNICRKKLRFAQRQQQKEKKKAKVRSNSSNKLCYFALKMRFIKYSSMEGNKCTELTAKKQWQKTK